MNPHHSKNSPRFSSIKFPSAADFLITAGDMVINVLAKSFRRLKIIDYGDYDFMNQPTLVRRQADNFLNKFKRTDNKKDPKFYME